MDVDDAPVLKRKGADPSELWLDEDGGHGFPAAFRATKSRRLDADAPPVVPAAVVPPPPPQTPGDVAMVKRKGALWMDDDDLALRATKSRRLDADMPPVVPGVVVPPAASEQTQPVAGFGVVEEAPLCGDVAVVPVDVAPGGNDERAIVLYRPAEAAQSLLLGPLRPGAPLRVSPDWIHGLKGAMLQETSNHRAMFPGEESSNLAMVPWAPWAPSRVQAPSTATDMTDAEDTSMEVEQDGADQLSTTHQWPQQQHCMVQQLIPAASYQPSPVTWSW